MEVTEYISRVSKCPELSTVCTSLLFLQFFDPQVFCSVALCYDDDILCSEYRHVLYVSGTKSLYSSFVYINYPILSLLSLNKFSGNPLTPCS
ncbi:hypothetical protein EYC84_004436 [Monilinia fructicola]|uniref:Uncharacterized protein n=1 Tax=Monilinia fructicola TaxID=38448 RepID=A0A5M9K473_MONFR|nr:hypothetical protein EYC84_004436 [Monilinia fructicola]